MRLRVLTSRPGLPALQGGVGCAARRRPPKTLLLPLLAAGAVGAAAGVRATLCARLGARLNQGQLGPEPGATEGSVRAASRACRQGSIASGMTTAGEELACAGTAGGRWCVQVRVRVRGQQSGGWELTSWNVVGDWRDGEEREWSCGKMAGWEMGWGKVCDVVCGGSMLGERRQERAKSPVLGRKVGNEGRGRPKRSEATSNTRRDGCVGARAASQNWPTTPTQTGDPALGWERGEGGQHVTAVRASGSLVRHWTSSPTAASQTQQCNQKGIQWMQLAAPQCNAAPTPRGRRRLLSHPRAGHQAGRDGRAWISRQPLWHSPRTPQPKAEFCRTYYALTPLGPWALGRILGGQRVW